MTVVAAITLHRRSFQNERGGAEGGEEGRRMSRKMEMIKFFSLKTFANWSSDRVSLQGDFSERSGSIAKKRA